MQSIDKLLLQTEHELIAEVIHSFDPNADIYLFGPGVSKPGKSIDIYINSQLIDKSCRNSILQILTNKFHLSNLDLVCGIPNSKTARTMETIAFKIKAPNLV